ncbi:MULTISPECIES: FAD-binding oxidoreductase [Planktothrix]|uniref:FAD linked oxidase-like protein n=1 Tax=Planktothrix rubescens CCAP 1459/22 TaxID=329571 RepID=A0A6J7ZGS5_PLARU|nr:MULTISPECIES: FAD-binding oxidoreductase [Planktothrix]CAC5340607.1 FAD linked oxidase-like protein [Planktothrix rubescens NIVA-CYA 18]CAD5939572.1 Glycolate oxidase subunit GlcD [Planktothrix rubescens NIVA-CYA 18]CAD5941272.1 Glycolate oxidase subunit GlcD [Planktothrix agardhii]
MNAISSTHPKNQQELEKIVGVGNVQPWDEIESVRQQQIIQGLASGTPIQGLIYPQTQQQLAEVIAYTNQQQLKVLPCGFCSKIDWGGLVKNIDFAVSTQGMNQLIEHAVGDLTVTVEAGMKFSQLQAILAQENQVLGFDPSYPETATIGGIIATGDTGSLRQRYRGIRDLILGISIVRYDGKIAKAGGRVVKNVAGYDLMKLFTGSYGTLGIISQITLRVYPQAEASGTVILTGEAEAISQVNQILLASALTPVAVDLISSDLSKILGFGDNIGLMVRFQSIAEGVKQQSQRLIELGEKLGLKAIYIDSDEENLWQQLKQQIWQSESNTDIVCKIGIAPTSAVKTLTQCQTLGIIHAGVGLGVLRFESVSPETLLNLRNWCESQGGFLSILKAPVDLKQQLEVWGYSGNALNLMRQIKQQFDPQNQFSPNRFVGGI